MQKTLADSIASSLLAPLLRSTLWSLLFISTCALANPTAAYAIRSQVTVSLFESRSDLKEIRIEGPVEISRPINQRFSGRDFALAIRKDGDSLSVFTVDKRTGKENHAVAHASIIWMRGLGPRGIAVRLAPGVVRTYRGSLIVSSITRGKDRDRVNVRNQLPTIDYVTGVVGSETPPNWPKEALKAQAVLTQTRLARLKPGEEFGDSTQQEAYLGSQYERQGIREAVTSVWGKTLQYNNSPIACFYHSCCAGATSKGTDIFGDSAKSMTYLKSVVCDYCKTSNFWKETKGKLAWRSFAKTFGTSLPQVLQRDKAGRPIALKLTGDSEISGYQFWIKLGQTFGWDKAPGTKFTLEKSTDSVIVHSTGAGHGVGLCQWGAAGLAKNGKTYKDILKFYFPGTALSK